MFHDVDINIYYLLWIFAAGFFVFGGGFFEMAIFVGPLKNPVFGLMWIDVRVLGW